nr:hemagglutinin repeat-containing protein [uncultured Cupriavidus sp.]
MSTKNLDARRRTTHCRAASSRNAGGLRPRVNPLYAAVVAWMPALAGAEMVPDQNAVQRATISRTANGTPLVNIVDPNQRGISHNRFQSLNVGTEGAVFNNSMKDGVSAIGGFAMNNANLTSQARAIIGEVTGGGRSAIHGAMEVFGGGADLIIANPNGIQVNGASTINANSLTLSTGKVLGMPDGSVRFGVDRGSVDIEGAGISTQGLSHFDIVSRTAQINGEINGGAGIKVVAGQLEYDVDTGAHTVAHRVTAGQPFAIDGSHLGSMYGGRVELVATDSGAGVRHQGVLLGHNNVSVTANGDIVIGVAESAKGRISIDGRNVKVNGAAETGDRGLLSQGDIAIKASQAVDVNARLESHGDMHITAGQSVALNGETNVDRDIAIQALDAIGVNADLTSETGAISFDATTLIQSAASIYALRTQVDDVTVPSIRINVGQYRIEGTLYGVGADHKEIPGSSVVMKGGRYYVLDAAGNIVPDARAASTAELGVKAGDIKLTAASTEIKGGALIADDGALEIDAAEMFRNDGLLKASGKVSVGTADFGNDGVVGGDDVNVRADVIRNAGGVVGNVVALESATLSNKGGIVEGNTIDIRNVAKLRNADKGSISAAVSLTLDSVDELVNDNAGLSAGETITLRNIKSLANQSGGTIVADGILEIDAQSVTNSESRIDASTALVVANGLRNAGGILNAKERLAIEVDSLDNWGGGVVKGVNALSVSATRVTNADAGSEISSEERLAISAESVDNGELATIASLGDATVVADRIRNLGGAELSVSRGLTLQGRSSLENLEGSRISAGNADMTTAWLKNSGEMEVDGMLAMTLDKLDNNAGTVAAETLKLRLREDLVYGGNAGALDSATETDISTDGSVFVNKQLTSFGKLKLDAAKDISNNGAIVSENGVELSARRIRNSESSLIWSGQDMSLTARESIHNGRNASILGQGQMSLAAGTILNEAGIIRSDGDMHIDARHVENKSAYGGDELGLGAEASAEFGARFKTGLLQRTWTWMKITLPTLTSNFVVDQAAEIGSGGHLRINQKGLYNANSNGDFSSVLNEGGVISASGDIRIKGNVVNQPKYLAVDLYSFLTEKRTGKIFIDDTNAPPHYFNSMYDLLDFLWGGNDLGTRVFLGSPIDLYNIYRDNGNPQTLIRNMEGATLSQIMASLFGPTWKAMSDADLSARWKMLKANGNAELRGARHYILPQEKGAISAGGNIRHDGGSLTNGIGGVKAENQEIHVKVGSQDVKIVAPAYDVSIILKKFEDISAGISTLPTLKDLTSLTGLFQRVKAKAAKGGKGAVGELSRGATTALVAGKVKVQPMYETAIEFIDQGRFYGSEYFFEQVGYASEQPATVIGDNYFINELIRRQLNNAVGAFFKVRDGAENAGLVKTLMTNAGSVDITGLEVGVALTAEQIAGLDKDIVWFVTETHDNTQVLVPRVYLAQSTLAAMRSGEGQGAALTHAAGSISIDAESVHNASGSMQAGKDVSIVSKGNVENVSAGMSGGVAAGGNVSMVSTAGDVINSGASIHAGGDVSMVATKGDVAITASAGYDGAGKLKLREFDDSITAGKDVNVEGRNVALNSATISARNNVKLAATDGDLKSNEMHEADSSYFYDRTQGVLNYTAVESRSAGAKGVGSAIRAGNELTLAATDDMTLEGGHYSGNAGKIEAGGKLDVKTTTNYDHSSSKVVVSQFGYAAGVKGFGFEASASGGAEDGHQTYMGVSMRQNPATDGNSNSTSGKKPGRAALDETASARFGYNKTEVSTATDSTAHKNAELSFGEKGLSIDAKTADIGGANIRTTGGLDVLADDIKSTKYLDEKITTQKTKSISIGASVEGHSAIADAVNKYGELGNKASKEGKDTDAGMTTLQVLGDISNLVFNDLAGASATVGINSSKTSSTATGWSENINRVEAGKIRMTARNDIELNGMKLGADEAELSAGGDLSMNAAKRGATEETSSSSFKLGVSAGASVSAFGSGVGASLDIGGSRENSSMKQTQHTNTTLHARSVSLSSGADTTLSGAHVTGASVAVKTGGNLNVESVQDVLDSDRSRNNWGVSVGVAAGTNGVIPTFSAQAGGGSEYRDERTTAAQTGITAKDGLQVNTTGDLNLKGGYLVSESGDGSVDVGGSLNATGVLDTVSQDGGYGGGGGGLSRAGVGTINAWGETVDEIDTRTMQNATIAGVSIHSAGVSGTVNTDAEGMSESLVDKHTSGNSISFTVGVSDIASKVKGSKTPRPEIDGGTDGSFRQIRDDMPTPTARAVPAESPATPRSGPRSGPHFGPDTPDANAGTGPARADAGSQTPWADASPATPLDGRAVSDRPPLHAPVTEIPRATRGVATPIAAGGTRAEGTLTPTGVQAPVRDTVDVARPVVQPPAMEVSTPAPEPASGTAGGVSVNPSVVTTRDPWPTVTPATPFIGAVGSSSGLPGFNGKRQHNTNNGLSFQGVGPNP